MERGLHFPARLYQIIEFESPQIIRWELDGKSFRIVNHNRFEKEVLPRYFRHGRVSSIQRQLNLYGFRCTHRGEDKGVFCHPEFQRGDYDLARQIRRKVRSPSESDDSKTDLLQPAESLTGKRKIMNDKPESDSKKQLIHSVIKDVAQEAPLFNQEKRSSSPLGTADLDEDALFLSICRDIARGDFFADTESTTESSCSFQVGSVDDLNFWTPLVGIAQF